ncbi:50S ribosomal protein L11 methyltransferase [Pendulispora albinea]|uniref:50S ribosomal protein L11 methyltransferase n=1 Tax=Pendulispora albinea TaxID=2741071 RepID=A0ABZ2M2E9_9BACT
MYTVRDFGDMIADRVRTESYEAALRRTVKPGSVVVDVGAGTGIFSLLACRFGARKVYAIEPNPALDVARALVRDNGFQDRVEFIPKLSTEVALPEQADVIVADLRGVMPTFSGSLAALIDARSRWLRPGGALIPKRDVFRVSVAEAPSLYDSIVAPWERSHFGFDASAARTEATSDWSSDRRYPIEPEHLLAPARTWATLDYENDTRTDVDGTVSLPIERSGVGHGLVVWFDAILTDEDRFSSQPGTKCIYSRVLFPWPSPVALEAGMTVEARLQAIPAADDYVHSWTTRFTSRTEFRQTNFFSRSKGSELLAGEEHRPTKLGPRGLAAQRTLELLGSGASIGEIATILIAAFPNFYGSRDAALVEVRALAGKYA